MALAGELDYDAVTDSVSSKSDDVSAERAVRRYLSIANNLVSAFKLYALSIKKFKYVRKYFYMFCLVFCFF